MDKIGCPCGMNLYVKDAVAVAVEAVTCFLKSGQQKRDFPFNGHDGDSFDHF